MIIDIRLKENITFPIINKGLLPVFSIINPVIKAAIKLTEFILITKKAVVVSSKCSFNLDSP